MSRELEINNASQDYIITGYNHKYIIFRKDVKSSFESGAKWTDENPKSPWISVEEDLPCNHEELIYGAEIDEGTETIDVFVANQDGAIWDDYMIYENNKWRWNDFEPAYWMIAPKLPKECKIKI